MKVSERNIYLYRGDNNKIVITINELTDNSEPFDPSTNPQVPVDISSYTFSMQIRTSTVKHAPLLLDVPSARFVKTDPTNGELTIELIPEDTEDLKLSDDVFDAFYDLQMDTGTQILTVCRGTAFIRRDVTE